MSCRHQGAGQCHDISDKLELSMSFHVTICPGNSSGEGGYKEVIGAGGGGQVLPLQKGGAGESFAVVLAQGSDFSHTEGGGVQKVSTLSRGDPQSFALSRGGGGGVRAKKFWTHDVPIL